MDYGVAAVEPAASKAPQGACIEMGSNPHPTQIKNADTQMGTCIFWQRMRDSNPRKRSQSPVCYRYTNPLYAEHLYYNQFF